MQFHKKLLLVLLLISLTMAGMASAQTVTVIAGDGLLVRPTQASTTLTVLVRNAQGQPVPGAVVNWALTGQGALAFTQSTADSTGQASNQYTAQILFGGNFATSVVTASALGVSANMNIITSGSDQSNIDNTFVNVQLLAPNLGDVTSGAAGSTSTTAVRLQIFAVGPTGLSYVPNVLVRLISDTSGTTIACQGNTGYSDINGNVNCLPVFGGTPASGRYTIEVGGGYRVFGPFNFTVTPGQVGAFRITFGNNQSGNPGATLPLTLTARVEDATGSPLVNVPVVWEAVVPGTATIANASNVSDTSGNVSATVTLGASAVGAVQVRLRTQTGNVSTLFTFQVNLTVTGFTKVAGDSQEAITNTAFAQPLIVQVTTAQGTVGGLQVQFTALGGVTLSNGGVATTNAQGQASVTVQAGSNPGPVTVTAAIGTFSTAFSLSIRLPGPQITSSSFFNGAGGQPGGVSPSAVLAIYGSGIAPGLQGCVTGYQIVGPIQILVSNVSVLFTSGSFAAYAPIYAVCNLGVGQQYVVVQVPAELPAGSTTSVTMRVGTGQTVLDGIPVTLVSPGIFETVYSDLRKRAVLLRDDGTYVSLASPARRGERLRAFVTGLGRPRSKNGFLIGTNQGGIPGDDASPLFNVILGVNNGGVTPESVVYAQDLIGVYVVTFVVPADSASGSDINFAVAAILNDVLIFGNPSKIPVQ